MLLGSPNLSCKQQKSSMAFVPSWGSSACTEEANHITHKIGSKLNPKWEGPYVVREVYSHGSHKIVDG